MNCQMRTDISFLWRVLRQRMRWATLQSEVNTAAYTFGQLSHLIKLTAFYVWNRKLKHVVTKFHMVFKHLNLFFDKIHTIVVIFLVFSRETVRSSQLSAKSFYCKSTEKFCWLHALTSYSQAERTCRIIKTLYSKQRNFYSILCKLVNVAWNDADIGCLKGVRLLAVKAFEVQRLLSMQTGAYRG